MSWGKLPVSIYLKVFLISQLVFQSQTQAFVSNVANNGLQVQDIGFTVLSQGTEPIVDIVFIHGLKGHPQNTWASWTKPRAEEREPRMSNGLRNFFTSNFFTSNFVGRMLPREEVVEEVPSNTQPEPTGSVFWSAHFLPQDIPNARILTYGYDSQFTNYFLSGSNQNTMFQHAKDLLFKLTAERGNCETRPIIFVAHSLGGIILKDVLRRSKDSEHTPEFQYIFKATNAILFFGTPHRGSGYASLGEIIRNIAALALMDTNPSLIRGLEIDSGELDILREEFAKILKTSPLRIYSFQEGKGVTGIRGFSGKVVDDVSSALDDASEIKVTINANHMDMCRFSTRDDDGYKSVTSVIKNQVTQIEKEIRARKKERARALSDEENDCLKTLVIDGWSNRRETIESSHNSTFQWVDQDNIIRSWMDNKSTSNVVWVSGKPGSGKSTLAKHIIRKMEVQNTTTANFFFNDRGHKLEKSEEGFLQSIMRQLLLQNSSLFEYILPTYRTKKQSENSIKWGTEFLRDTLISMIRGSEAGSIWLVIDAFDECEAESRDAFLKLFRELSTCPSTRILITSRPDSKLGHLMRNHPKMKLEDMTQDDIEKYITAELDDFVGPEEKNSKALTGLEQMILNRSQGVFLWVKLVVKELTAGYINGGSVQELRKALGVIPSDLEALYDRMFGGLDTGKGGEAQRMLEWVIFSGRPLKIAEFRHAIAIGSREDITSLASLDAPEAFIPLDRMKSRIRSMCGDFLEVVLPAGVGTGGDEIVQLIHQSAKDFLLEKRVPGSNLTTLSAWITPPEAHTHLARGCIRYLSLSNYDLPSGPLYSYAGEYWTKHAPLAHISQTAQQMEGFNWGMDFRNWNHWRSNAMSWDLRIILQNNADKATPIIIASGLGLPEDVKYFLGMAPDSDDVGIALIAASTVGHEKIVQLLIDNGADVNLVGGGYGTALQLAARYGHEKIVQLLIDNGAGVNHIGGGYGTALQLAARYGHEKILQLLIDNGADVNHIGGGYGTALHAAARYGHEKIVQLLIDNGAGVNHIGGEYGTALQLAARYGHEKIVQLLIDNGADMNHIGGEYGTALQAAAHDGHEKIVQLLIDNGADMNHIGGGYGTALHAAARYGHEKIVQLLIDNGVGVNHIGGEYGTALQLAARYGHEKIVQLLIDNGADVNLVGGGYGTALQLAARYGHEKIVQLLIDNGADMNHIGGEYVTALQAAAFFDHEKIVQLLIDNGADVNHIGGELGTALQAATLFDHEKIVQLLIDNGADVNLIGGRYGIALQAATLFDHEKIVQLLIDNGADVNLIGGRYGIALQAAARAGHEKIVQLLIDNGADVNLIGEGYGTALQAATIAGHEKIVQLLIDNGADVNLIGEGYGTALQVAARDGHEKIVQLLIDNGADVNHIGGRYGIALQLAARDGHEKIVQLLIDNGADVNLIGGRYGTALQAATLFDHEKVVQLLIDNGADVNLIGGRYGIALQAAARDGHEKIVQLLIDNGADVNLIGEGYGTALHAAALFDHEKIVQLLIDNGADVNLIGGEYGTALQAAALFDHEKIVQLLIDNGADVNLLSKTGQSALYIASDKGYEAVVELLIKNGANVNPVGDKHGGNILEAASRKGHIKIVELLLANGAKKQWYALL